MNYRLVALDLDCTLLDSQFRISPDTIEIIRRLHGRGVRFIIATGRMHRSAMMYVRQLGFSVPVISYNGALIIENRKTLMCRGLEQEACRRALTTLPENRFLLFSGDRLFVREYTNGVEKYIKRARVAYNFYPDLFFLPSDPVKILLVPEDFDRDLELIRTSMGSSAYITYSTRNFIELMNPSVSKAVALKKYCEDNGFSPSEVIAFGDGENDSAMLEMVGLGVAMGNAGDPVKRIADEVAPTNDEEGVCKVLGRIFERD